MRVGYPAALVTIFVAAVLGWGLGWWLGAPPATPPPLAAVSTATPAATLPGTPTSEPPGLPTFTIAPRPVTTASPALGTDPPGTDSPPPTTVLEIEGAGDLVSESFDVVNGWQILWQTDGESFAYAIRGDQDVGTVVKQTGPSSGVTSIVPFGRFHLEVTAKGSWSIKVVQGG
jgi:hypothetical protein